ncbi:helix-turn-helix transcriptional regulator [Kribbella sp. NPDC050124]|uniref:helix-turn-helix transcriptional regulator n=1 Tax=Kribbella sp. NPDC050124 TaxID=3364114 RepID=UPI00379A68B0
MTETPPVVDDQREARRLIAGQIRLARNQRGLSQASLGARVDVSRYVINRIEGENQDLPLDLAAKLAGVLDLPDLENLTRAQFESSPRIRHANTRDARLKELLNAPGLDRLEIVVGDELDIIKLLEGVLLDLPPTVNIIFPTHARQQQLRGPVGPNAATWAVQNQITRIFEALAVGGRLHPADGELGSDINLYESDDVRQSFVLVSSKDGLQCAVWPALPNVKPTDVDAIPVLVSRDSAYIRLIEDHLTALKADKQPLTHLKAVVVVDRGTESTSAGPVAQHRLSSYFRLGTDSEQVAAAGEDDTTGRFGFGVSLILIHGYFERTGRPLGRRVLLPKDSKSATFQLFSTHISDEDLERTGERGARSTATHRSARRRLIEGDREAAVNSPAFIRAARHGLLDELGADVPAGALQEIFLPEPLWIVEKTDPDGNRLMPVVPRLFHLDLTPRNYQDEAYRARIEGAGEVGTMRLDDWLASVDSLEAALLETTESVAFGQRDLLTPTEPLNDFLETARTKTKDWFNSVLQDLKIVME